MLIKVNGKIFSKIKSKSFFTILNKLKKFHKIKKKISKNERKIQTNLF